VVAVGKLTDQPTLAKIAVQDKDWQIRKTALVALTDEPLLAKLAIHDTGTEAATRADEWENFSCLAVAEIKDPSLLAQVAIESPRKLSVRDEERKFSGRDTRGANIYQITWGRVSESRLDANEKAVFKLTDRALLDKVKVETKEPHVRDCVVLRLAALNKQDRATNRNGAADPDYARGKITAMGLPWFEKMLYGTQEVCVSNPTAFAVAVGIRSGNWGRDFVVPAKGNESVFVSAGHYDLYFVRTDMPNALFQGDSLTLSGNSKKIELFTGNAKGNYLFRQVQ